MGKGEKVPALAGLPGFPTEGKSSPVSRVTGAARKTPPGARPNRFRFERGPFKSLLIDGIAERVRPQDFAMNAGQR